MTTTLPLPQLNLSDLRIASPCPARWEDMQGDQRRRFCSLCHLHVHNLSAMTRAQAEALVASASGGRLCVRLWRRADGTVITQDCPVGLARARAALRRTAARAAAAIGLAGLCSTIAAASADRGGAPRLRWLQPIAFIADKLNPRPSPGIVGKLCVMGDVAPRPPAGTPPPPPTLGNVAGAR